jgi:hypothetical protein
VAEKAFKLTGHAMHNCFVHGAYGSGVWTTEIADDFEFRNRFHPSALSPPTLS